MSLTEVVVVGTLKPDGTLELAWIPTVPFGLTKSRSEPVNFLEKSGPGALSLLVFLKSDKPISTLAQETRPGCLYCQKAVFRGFYQEKAPAYFPQFWHGRS